MKLFKKKRNVETKLSVGTILSYMYPNGLSCLYFQVVEIKGKYCVVRELEIETTRRSKDGLYYFTVPKPNEFRDDSKPLRRMIRELVDGSGKQYVRVKKGHCMWIWSGREFTCCTYD